MRTGSERAPFEKRLDGAGWGLLFIWVGIALATRVGWGVALVGVGLIMLGIQVLRKMKGLVLDGFALTVGALFVAGGILDSLGASVGLVPLLCIGVGVVLLVAAIAGRRPSGRSSGAADSASHGRA